MSSERDQQATSGHGEESWIISVDPEHALAPVVGALGKLGLQVGQVLEIVHVLVVNGTSRQADLARSVAGVTDVSRDEPVDIGPPDAEVS